VHDLRYHFSEVERFLDDGEEIEITKGERAIARLLPVASRTPRRRPDFLARLRAIYGTRMLKVSGAEVLMRERSRY
jgi:antitoxin (DNA-binding transcriptional repressor) of toxin-antitoxin stability system